MPLFFRRVYINKFAPFPFTSGSAWHDFKLSLKATDLPAYPRKQGKARGSLLFVSSGAQSRYQKGGWFERQRKDIPVCQMDLAFVSVCHACPGGALFDKLYCRTSTGPVAGVAASELGRLSGAVVDS